MRNRLPCSDARIKTNAEALGLVKPLDLRLHDINEREEVHAFLGRCCPPVSNSATSHDQRMPDRHRRAIPDSKRQPVAGDVLGRWNGGGVGGLGGQAEDSVRHCHGSDRLD